jgi:4-amino-4-deoxy-L-arabinose transferase-like glycosyltransferase
MRWWDESMFAVNTYEMLHNGKYFSFYFDNAPDLLNTKPTFTSWIQLFFVKLFGYNELALRLPSAIAAASSVLLIFYFIHKHFNLTWAWLSALILLTSNGFINFHTGRTADSDSLLSVFILIANLYFLKYTFTNEHRNIFFCLLFLCLAFATKMYAALLFCPAYLAILFRTNKLKSFILNGSFFLGIGIFLISNILLIYFREMDTPGFIQQILAKDAGRLFVVVENHREPIDFYFTNLFGSRYSFWIILAVLGSLLAFISKSALEKNLLFSLFILISVYLLIITISITKLEWYDMPLYPYLSVIAAYPIYLLFEGGSFESISLSKKQIALATLIIFIYPYYMMFDKAQGNTLSNGEKLLEANEAFIFKKIKENKDLSGMKVYYSQYKGSLLFYKYKLAEKNQNIDLTKDPKFAINDRVLVCDDSLKTIVTKRYAFEEIDSYNNAQLIRIKDTLTN